MGRSVKGGVRRGEVGWAGGIGVGWVACSVVAGALRWHQHAISVGMVLCVV